VRFAIENLSLKLEINDAKTKVRRVDPIPDEDETEGNKYKSLCLIVIKKSIFFISRCFKNNFGTEHSSRTTNY